MKDNAWAPARPLTVDGLVYKHHVCNESLTVTTLNRLEIFPGDGAGYFLVLSLDNLTLDSPLCVWQRVRRSSEGKRRNSPVLQRVLCVFGGDLSRHWVQKRRRPVIVAVGAERRQKNVTFPPSIVSSPIRTLLQFYTVLKLNVGMTISGPAECEGAPRPSRAKSTRRIILLPALGLSAPPSLPALQVLLISARKAHSSLQLEHERMLVSQHRMRKQISAGWDQGGEE